MRRALAGWALVLLAAAAIAAGAEESRVARSELRGSGAAGIVFFLAAEGKAGAVAVGAAHSFDRTRLGEIGEIAFLPARGGGGPLAVSRRYYAKPGQAFHRPGATPRDDFLIFALDDAPRNVRLLEPARGLPYPGERVRILGLRGPPTAGEVELLGTVRTSAAGSIEVDLDAPVDLRGWGGAPVLLEGADRVIGLLQAAWPGGSRTHTRVGPITGVKEALAEPYEAGIGRLFATMAPAASAANSPVRRRRAATRTPYGDLSPDATAARLRAVLPREAPEIGPSESVQLTLYAPAPDTVFGESAGAFLAGHALAQRSGSGRFDIFIVVDTSESTHQPSGVDVDGDGEVGVPGSKSDESTDPGDSVLAAEIAAASRLIAELDPQRTRVGIVSFAGEPVAERSADWNRPSVRVAALTQEPLTYDYRRVRAALAELSREEPRGMTHMAAGIDLATLELLGLAGSVGSADPTSTKLILFFTDGRPTLPRLDSELANVGAVLRAAERAHRAGVRIHAFAIGPEALEGPIATVEMASITAGTFTPVRDPGRLVEVVDEVRFAHVDAVEVRNASSGALAHDVRVHADGSWDALVPLEVGKNRLEVVARSSRGALAREAVLVHYAPGVAAPPIPAELLAKYNTLLQRRLLKLEFDRVEAMRRELVVEIERERVRAVERAAEQRKELELEFLGPEG